jgi:hypothetical protein
MNERIGFLLRAKAGLLVAGGVIILSFGIAHAEGAMDVNKTALLPPPAQEDQLILKRRLKAIRGDIDSFRIFAENFRKNGDMKLVDQLQNPVDEFMKKHVDNLLAQNTEYSTLDTTRLTAEVMYVKARLYMSLNRNDDARKVVADMKKRFGSYQKISVELPDKTTTLDEGIRLLDADLAKTAPVSKNAPAK